MPPPARLLLHLLRLRCPLHQPCCAFLPHPPRHTPGSLLQGAQHHAGRGRHRHPRQGGARHLLCAGVRRLHPRLQAAGPQPAQQVCAACLPCAAVRHPACCVGHAWCSTCCSGEHTPPTPLKPAADRSALARSRCIRPAPQRVNAPACRPDVKEEYGLKEIYDATVAETKEGVTIDYAEKVRPRPPTLPCLPPSLLCWPLPPALAAGRPLAPRPTILAPPPTLPDPRSWHPRPLTLWHPGSAGAGRHQPGRLLRQCQRNAGLPDGWPRAGAW